MVTNIRKCELAQTIVNAGPLDDNWDGDFISLSDEQKDAVIMYIVTTDYNESGESGYVCELIPGADNNFYLFRLLYTQPHDFMATLKRLYETACSELEPDDNPVTLLLTDATQPAFKTLHAMLIANDIGFCELLKECIYMYLEPVIRDYFGEHDMRVYH